MKLFEFYRDILLEKEKEKEKKEPLPDKKVPEKPVPEKDFGEPITKEFEKKVLSGFANYGCDFLFKMVNELTNQLKNSKDKGESKFIQTRIQYIEKRKEYQKCKKDVTKFDMGKEPVKTKDKKIKKTVTTTEPKTTVPTITTKTTEPVVTQTLTKEPETPTSVDYGKINVIPQTLYGTEDEIIDLTNIQTDEYINDIIIDLETQIVNQKPEVQEKLEEFNIDAEKMSKLVPLTTETKDFMMGLDNYGIKLPYLMLLYENIEIFYEFIRNNDFVDPTQLKPLSNKVINYNEFWDWSKTLWNKTSNYLIEKVSGTIPELGEDFTVFP